jgi:hypothetical protein
MQQLLDRVDETPLQGGSGVETRTGECEPGRALPADPAR